MLGFDFALVSNYKVTFVIYSASKPIFMIWEKLVQVGFPGCTKLKASSTKDNTPLK